MGGASDLEKEIDNVKAQLLAVESDQKDVELALEDSSNLTLPNYLKGLTREQLRDELKQLREKEKQLRDEKSLLLQLKLQLQLQLQQPGYAEVPVGPKTTSEQVCAAWLSDTSSLELPPAERVRNFLEMRVGPGGADPVVLPLPPSTMAKLQQTLQWNSLQRNVAPASSMDGAEELLRVVAAAVHADEIVVGPSESWTAIMTNAAIVRVLLMLDSLAPDMLRLAVAADRNEGEAGVTSSSTSGRTLRPDLVLRSKRQSFVYLLAEEKGRDHSLDAAMADLRDKRTPWSPLTHGRLPYFPCFAATGNFIQFFAQTPSNALLEVSRIFDVTRLADRVDLVLTVVQLYKLLVLLQPLYPTMPAPTNCRLVYAHPAGWTRELSFGNDLKVKKVVKGWENFVATFPGVSFEDLKVLYRKTAGAPGVIRSTSGPVLSPRGRYRVNLSPVGILAVESLLTSERELAHAVRGVLRGLVAIHKAGFVHRDLRWANVSRDANGEFFLIDLEMAGRAGGAVQFKRLREWDDNTLERAGPAGPRVCYTEASDMYQLGKMIKAAADKIGVASEDWDGAAGFGATAVQLCLFYSQGEPSRGSCARRCDHLQSPPAI